MEDGGDEMAPDFGALLRRYRLASGLSQEALAERARLSPYGISALERGYRRTPQRDTLELLAGALALTSEQRRAFETAAARAASPRRRDGAAVTVGPWLGGASADLPLALTPFIGREDELDEIAALLREHRLVTITGAGGIGKTQTALRAAAAFSKEAQAAVCLVELAPIRDPSLVATAIANALGLQEVPNHPLIETLTAFLKNKTALLLLDNCEHVISEAATVANSLLHACPHLRILATSREPLRAAGERTYRLPSLEENDAVALFDDRAQAADIHFSLTELNKPAVCEICRSLSGIPLAIELAAARVPTLPLSLVRKELDDRFNVLIGGDRTAPPRQQTVHGMIDWSYELLAAAEQRVFERLSVFVGGCAISEATAVCHGEEIAADDVLPLISSLVSKSLIVAYLEGDEPRYLLLEPFREYAREKLKARGEEDAIAQRHLLAYIEDAAYFVWRDQQSRVHYGHPGKELGNWRAAVRWALTERNDVLGGQRLVGDVVCLWGATNAAINDARRWIPAAFELVDEQTPPDVIAKLRLAKAEVTTQLEQWTLSLASAGEAVAYFREAGDTLRLARALTVVGAAFDNFGRIDEARATFEEALCIARKIGSRWDTWRVLRNLGLCLLEHDVVASRTYLTEASQLLQAADDRYNSELMASDFASLAFHEGDIESCLRQLTDVCATGDNLVTSGRFAITARLGIAECLMVLGRYHEAREHASGALGAAREAQLDVLIASSLGFLASIAVLRGPSHEQDVQVRAARIMGFLDARLQALDSTPFLLRDQVFPALREALGAETFANLVADGAIMTEDEAVEAATAL